MKVMDHCSRQSFIQSFIRLSCEFGYPKFLLTNEGSHLVKGCQTMQLCFKDIKGKLHKDMVEEYDIQPVGGHKFNGKSERKIRQTKESLKESVSNQRLSVLQWEAVAAEINKS